MPTISKVTQGIGFPGYRLGIGREVVQVPDTGLRKFAEDEPVINAFLKLAVVTSPSVVIGHPMQSEIEKALDEVRNLYANMFVDIGVPTENLEIDNGGSLIVRVPGTEGYKDKQPIMLMGHVDIVPANPKDPLRPVRPTLIKYDMGNSLEDFIASDGTTTLGADDKSSLAIIWNTVRRLYEENIPHVPLEIVISPDEESTCASVDKLDRSRLHSKYIIIVDHEEEFNITTGTGGFVDLKININGLQGGHSAVDIDNKDIVSAADLLLELLQIIGNRVIKYHPNFPGQPLISKNISGYGLGDVTVTTIPNSGWITLSIRSLSKKEEDAELERILHELKRIEGKYKPTEPNLQITIKMEKWPSYEGNNDSPIALVAESAGKKIGHPETYRDQRHWYAQSSQLGNMTNARGEKFEPIIIGPTVLNEHSSNEKQPIHSMLEVDKWLFQIIKDYTQSV